MIQQFLIIFLVISMIAYGLYRKYPESFLSKYINFNLTVNPRANNAPFPMYTWWKYYPPHRMYVDCNQYRCATSRENGCTASPQFNLADHKYVAIGDQLCDVSKLPHEDIRDYYGEPAKFCQKNPKHRLCPNNWLEGST